MLGHSEPFLGADRAFGLSKAVGLAIMRGVHDNVGVLHTKGIEGTEAGPQIVRIRDVLKDKMDGARAFIHDIPEAFQAGVGAEAGQAFGRGRHIFDQTISLLPVVVLASLLSF